MGAAPTCAPSAALKQPSLPCSLLPTCTSRPTLGVQAGAVDIDGDSKATPCLLEPPAAAFQALQVNPTGQDAAELAAALLGLNRSAGCGGAALPSSLLPQEGLAAAGRQEEAR